MLGKIVIAEFLITILDIQSATGVNPAEATGLIPESLMSQKEAPGAWMGPGGFPIPPAVRFMVHEGSGFENPSLGSHTHACTQRHTELCDF